MQLNNSMKSDSIDALGSILINSINNAEEDRVLKNLKRMDVSIEKLFNLSNNKFNELLLNKERNENKNSFWSIDKNYSSAFYSILKLYSGCIKAAIESNRVNIAIHCKRSFGKLLRHYLLKKKDNNLLEMYFNEQENLFKYCLDQNNGLSNSFGFHWYYDLTFDWSNTYGLFDLEYLDRFDKQIFKYIRYAIDTNNERWLREWIKWLHNGIGFMDLNTFSSYKYFGHVSNISNFTSLDEKFKNIYSYDSYLDFVTLLKEKHLEWIDQDNINIDKKEIKLRETIKKAHTAYLFMNTKHLLFSSFAYSLYKNSFNLLIKMLNVNNNSKSEVIMVGHKVFPKDINDIMELWIKDDCLYDDERWKFKFGEVFSENEYHERILTFIFITHLNLPEESQPTNLKKFSIAELMFLKDKVIKLNSKIDDFNSFESKIKEIYTDLDFTENIERIKSIFNKTIETLSHDIETKINLTDISTDLIDEFKNGFYDDYKSSSGYIKYILHQLYEQCFANKQYHENIDRFGLKDSFPRRYFVKETNTVVDYLGKQLCNRYNQGVNTEFTRKVLEKSENIYLDNIDKIIEKIGIDDVLILTTNHSDILSNIEHFKNSWEVENDSYNIYPDGYYVLNKKNIPIFSFYTNTNDSKTFFINKNHFLKWNDYVPSLETNNVKENIYLSIKEEGSDNVVLYLYGTFELIFPEKFESYVIDG